MLMPVENRRTRNVRLIATTSEIKMSRGAPRVCDIEVTQRSDWSSMTSLDGVRF